MTPTSCRAAATIRTTGPPGVGRQPEALNRVTGRGRYGRDPARPGSDDPSVRWRRASGDGHGGATR